MNGFHHDLKKGDFCRQAYLNPFGVGRPQETLVFPISPYLSKSEATDALDLSRVKTRAYFYRKQVRLPIKARSGRLKWLFGGILQWSGRRLSENHDFRRFFWHWKLDYALQYQGNLASYVKNKSTFPQPDFNKRSNGEIHASVGPEWVQFEVLKQTAHKLASIMIGPLICSIGKSCTGIVALR